MNTPHQCVEFLTQHSEREECGDTQTAKDSHSQTVSVKPCHMCVIERWCGDECEEGKGGELRIRTELRLDRGTGWGDGKQMEIRNKREN